MSVNNITRMAYLILFKDHHYSYKDGKYLYFNLMRQ